jgi:hypothetical protein
VPIASDSVGSVERQLRDGSWVPTPTQKQVLAASVRVRNRIAEALTADNAEAGNRSA